MKKSEFSQLTQIIEHLVRKEVRKQLPVLIEETFKDMTGKSTVNTNQKIEPVAEEQITEEPINFKASLRELFAGTSVMKSEQQESQDKQIKQYTKDPKLNAILNETKSDLRARERLISGAAFAGGFDTSTISMREASEPSFITNVPTTAPTLVEGQSSDHAPLSSLPDGISALDLAKRGAIDKPELAHALTRNYSDMMKLIDKKKNKK